MKAFQMILPHYCGEPLVVMVDAAGPDDDDFRTWALCPRCRQIGLITKGNWMDPRLLSDEELSKYVGPVQ